MSPSRWDLLLEQLLMLNSTAAACWAGNKKGQIHVYSSQRYEGENKKKPQKTTTTEKTDAETTRMKKKQSHTQRFPHNKVVFALGSRNALVTYVNEVLSAIFWQPQLHNRSRAARKSTRLVSRHNLLGCKVDFTGFLPAGGGGPVRLVVFLVLLPPT